MSDKQIVGVAEVESGLWQVTVNNVCLIGYADRNLAVAAAESLVNGRWAFHKGIPLEQNPHGGAGFHVNVAEWNRGWMSELYDNAK